MLPKIDTRVIEEIKLLTANEKLLLRPYNIAQEKSLLLSLSSDEKSNWVANAKNVIEQNLKSGDLSKVKSAIDFLYLCLKLRMISKSDKLEYTFRCPTLVEDQVCGHLFQLNDSIDSLLKIENADSLKLIHKINDTLTVELIPAHIDYVNELAQLHLSDAKKYESMTDQQLIHESLDVICKELSYHISKVFVNESGNEKMYDKFSHQEVLENVIENLTIEEITSLYNAKKKLINLKIRIEKNCPKCKKTFKKEMTNFFEFII